MNITTSRETQITDCNHRDRGIQRIEIEWHEGLPWRVEHAGRSYWFRGKSGHHFASGEPTREMVTGEERIWINLDGSRLWED